MFLGQDCFIKRFMASLVCVNCPTLGPAMCIYQTFPYYSGTF